jgi:hypothetical protein
MVSSLEIELPAEVELPGAVTVPEAEGFSAWPALRAVGVEGAVSAAGGSNASRMLLDGIGAMLSCGAKSGVAATPCAGEDPASSAIGPGAETRCAGRAGLRSEATIDLFAGAASKKKLAPNEVLMTAATRPTSPRYKSEPTGSPVIVTGELPRIRVAGGGSGVRSSFSGAIDASLPATRGESIG